jgi:hypothetical protein
MHGIARGSLLNLRQLSLRITYREIAHVVTPIELRSQKLDGTRTKRPLNLRFEKRFASRKSGVRKIR